jgi:molybdopterin biosynthesis enzyme
MAAWRNPLPPVADTLEALEQALARCAGADVIIFSGGSSVGDRDLSSDLVQRHGTVVFHGIASSRASRRCSPRLATCRSSAMPGNPTSCLSNAYILLVPFSARHRQATDLRAAHRQRAARPPHRVAGRASQFYTVRLVDDVAFPAFKGSGDITSLSQATDTSRYLRIRVSSRKARRSR